MREWHRTEESSVDVAIQIWCYITNLYVEAENTFHIA